MKDEELELIEEQTLKGGNYVMAASYPTINQYPDRYGFEYLSGDSELVFRVYRKKTKAQCKFKIGEVWAFDGERFVVTSVAIEDSGLFVVSTLTLDAKKSYFGETSLYYRRATKVSALVGEDAE